MMLPDSRLRLSHNVTLRLLTASSPRPSDSSHTCKVTQEPCCQDTTQLMNCQQPSIQNLPRVDTPGIAPLLMRIPAKKPQASSVESSDDSEESDSDDSDESEDAKSDTMVIEPTEVQEQSDWDMSPANSPCTTTPVHVLTSRASTPPVCLDDEMLAVSM
ncbi:uncharacterized protein EDB91DRAFT_1145937 [Suillus paluster]|uniref:uncharacterized protein n=1 Tax=Suillus paluster TaxID=48578 RepID=UPI001B862739|nr:uncharacterized protein EDB91DRAFT_1145937 [Suillus paluster]KAG1734908.1 hypothetical protein EDB91DRAFT_1145937 [Suillus paluster]